MSELLVAIELEEQNIVKVIDNIHTISSGQAVWKADPDNPYKYFILVVWDSRKMISYFDAIMRTLDYLDTEGNITQVRIDEKTIN